MRIISSRRSRTSLATLGLRSPEEGPPLVRLELRDRNKTLVLLTPSWAIGTLPGPLCDKSNLTCPTVPHIVILALTIGHCRACPCYTCPGLCCVTISPATSDAQKPTLGQIILPAVFRLFPPMAQAFLWSVLIWLQQFPGFHSLMGLATFYILS